MIKEGLDSYHPDNRQEAKDSNDWASNEITENEFRDLLAKKIDSVNIQFVKDDIKRIIKNPEVLRIWSSQYFHNLTTHLKIKEG